MFMAALVLLMSASMKLLMGRAVLRHWPCIFPENKVRRSTGELEGGWETGDELRGKRQGEW